MTDYVDVIIPRGGKNLVKLIQDNAKVPVFAHLEGIVHTYIHNDAKYYNYLDPKIGDDYPIIFYIAVTIQFYNLDKSKTIFYRAFNAK